MTSVPFDGAVSRFDVKRYAWWVVLAVIAVSLVVSVWPSGNNTPRTPDQRVAHLASQVRCPTCAGLSVAQSEAPLAQSSKEEIRTRVSDGQSDQQIRDYFVSRYGDTALMSPAKNGINRIPWLLPVLLVIAGAAMLFAIVHRWRGGNAVGPLTPTSDDRVLVEAALSNRVRPELPPAKNLETERDFLLDSIEDLDREHVSGALEDQEYTELRDQHVVRAAGVLRAITQELNAPTVRPEPRAKKAASFLRSRQKMVWTVGVIVLVLGAGFGISQVVADRGNGEITGDVANNSTALLAQAQQQTSNGKASDALKTYDKILKIDPNNVLALTYKGWLLNLAGLQDEGYASIEKAIAADPTFADPHFFKGYILLNSKNDPNGAITEFNTFLASNPPEDLVTLVQQALADAKARAAAPPAQ